jgi:hypothetical protein
VETLNQPRVTLALSGHSGNGALTEREIAGGRHCWNCLGKLLANGKALLKPAASESLILLVLLYATRETTRLQ